jgi:hypothetical protein
MRQKHAIKLAVGICLADVRRRERRGSPPGAGTM